MEEFNKICDKLSEEINNIDSNYHWNEPGNKPNSLDAQKKRDEEYYKFKLFLVTAKHNFDTQNPNPTKQQLKHFRNEMNNVAIEWDKKIANIKD
jgi:hypothetical protein